MGTTRAGNLPLIGGAWCLDFANTVSWRASSEPQEWLTSYEDLVDWACHADVIPAATGRQLRRAARAKPADAAAALHRAQELREAIYRAFSRQAAGKAPAGADLDRIRARYVDAARHARFAAPAGADRWFWLEDSAATLDLVTRMVARSAVELALSADLERVRECLGERCGWLFLDRSRNRSRRWCSSADCGNRARVRRFYQRRRGSDRRRVDPRH